MNGLIAATALIVLACAGMGLALAQFSQGPVITDIVDEEAAAAPRAGDDWRRTERGWERRGSWRAVRSSAAAPLVDLRRLHPIFPGAFVVVVGVGALVAEDQGRRRPK